MAGLKKLVGVSVDFYFLHKSPKCVIEGQLLSSFCFLVSLGLPRLSVSITAFLTSSSSFPERGVSWCSCSRQGGWGHFLLLCVSLAISLAFLWGQPPNQVSQCHWGQHFRSQAGVGGSLWMTSDLAQMKRDGGWHRNNGRQLGVNDVFPGEALLPRTPVQGNYFFNTLQFFRLIWRRYSIKAK